MAKTQQDGKEPKEITTTEEASIQAPKSDIESLISQAIKGKSSVETMERLLAMRKQLKDEWAKEQYDRAMAKLQSELPVIEKNKKAGDSSFTYNYAPLEFIIEKTKEPISNNGFSYYFDTEDDGEFMIIYCHTTHSAGFMKTSKFKLPIDKTARMNATQKYGSALTYGKRYCFCNAFGIVVGGEDNDAQQPAGQAKVAPKQTSSQQTRPTEKEEASDLISVKQVNFIKSLLKAKGYTEAALLKKFEITKMEEFTKDQASTVISNLQKIQPKKPAEQAPANEEVIEGEQVEEEPIDLDEVDRGIEQQRLEREGK